jgi:hypothetical protein
MTAGAADALKLERRGAVLSRVDHVVYDDIRGVRTEEQPRSMFTRNLDMWSSAARGQRALILRAGAAPLRVGDGLGHEADAIAWLAARIESTSRDARRRSPVRAYR